MATLSVIIITKNEQSHIENCIKSVVGLADEIIVVDSQSTDRTAEIARSMGAKVSITTDWQGFGIQKNRALALSTSEWVLSLDADERVTPELALEIKSVLEGKTGDPRETCYLINRQSWYCGRLIKHSGWQEDKILRLFKRGAAEFTNDKVHERIIRTQHASNSDTAFKEGRVLNGLMLHYSFSDFDQVLLKVNRYSSLWAEQQALQGRRSTPLKALVHGISAFCKAYIFKCGFLDGAHGLALALSNAEGAYYKYLKLWHLNWTKTREGRGEQGDQGGSNEH